ncbi:MAG: hypothetical protein O2816_12920, partial [Planctomycetota bacterium]|nr:hypothetical protein [Planctomycetota bacterium]
LFQLVFGGLGGFCGSLLAGRAGEWARAGDTLDPSRLFLVPLAFATAATVLLWLCYPRRSAQP